MGTGDTDLGRPSVRDEATPAVERQYGSLAMSQVDGAGSLATMRAVNWHNVLVALGLMGGGALLQATLLRRLP